MPFSAKTTLVKTIYWYAGIIDFLAYNITKNDRKSIIQRSMNFFNRKPAFPMLFI